MFRGFVIWRVLLALNFDKKGFARIIQIAKQGIDEFGQLEEEIDIDLRPFYDVKILGVGSSHPDGNSGILASVFVVLKNINWGWPLYQCDRMNAPTIKRMKSVVNRYELAIGVLSEVITLSLISWTLGMGFCFLARSVV